MNSLLIRNLIMIVIYSTLVVVPVSSYTQGSIYTFRAGPTLAMQRWNGVGNNSPLIAYHAVVGVESYEPDKPIAFIAELGYHLRGMSQRTQPYRDDNGIDYPAQSIQNKFHNLGLSLGARKNFGDNDRFFYLLALRGEYTLAFKLSQNFVGFDRYVRRFNYGLDVGGGVQFPLGVHMGFVQVMFQPDASKQIYSQPFYGYDYQGNPRTYPEQKVFNYSFELSVGLRILGNAEYEE